MGKCHTNRSRPTTNLCAVGCGLNSNVRYNILESKATITSNAKAQDLIETLRRLSVSRATIDEFPPFLEKLFHYLPLTAITVESPAIYRSRPNDIGRLYEHVSELKYPPFQAVRSKGRFNDVGESIFYGALCEPGCIIETKPNLGQLFTISTSIKRDGREALFFPLGILNRNFTPIGRTPAHKLLIDWLHSELTKEIRESSDYNSTIAISRILLHKGISKSPFDNFAGIAYPSIPGRKMANQITYNLAMRADVYDRNFHIAGAEVVCLLDAGSHYDIQTLNECQVSPDGVLKWRHSHSEMISNSKNGINCYGNFSEQLSKLDIR